MKLPDGPKIPPLLQTIEWILNPLETMERSAQKYGDVFTLPVGLNFRPLVFVSHPQAVQEILDSKQFESPGELNAIFTPLLGQQSVISLSGDRHRRERQLLLPPFHGERMRAYGQIVCDLARQVMNEAAATYGNRAFSMRSLMQKISLAVILQAVFGIDEGQRYQELERFLTEILDLTGSPVRASLLFFPWMQKDLGAWSPWGNFLRKERLMNELIYSEIRERRENFDPSRTDILSLLLSARDDRGEGLSDVELRDELMTLLVAGHETTASALAWAFYWIHKLPEVRQKLMAELDSLGEASGDSAMMKLPYLNAVCCETLRIYPVGMITFPRVPKVPVKLMDYQIEPGAIVLGSIYLTHHREDIYPEPKRFRPERFLERQFSPYEYLPFGGGSRRCIGMAFAQFEMKLVLATILSEWELGLADSRPVLPARRGLTLSPAGGVKMAIKGRRSPNSTAPATNSLAVF
jgi:cytochrome P450